MSWRAKPAAFLVRRFGSPRSLLRGGLERMSLRAAAVRWLLVVAGLSALGAIWYQPSNLARHATVSMSSNCDVPAAYTREPPAPVLLVDGRRDRDYDACTATELHPWVQLDLPARVAIERVVVRGRKDCCWNVSSSPLVMEVSEDGSEFRQVRRRTLPFTQDEPWRASLAGDVARQLRIRSEADRATDLALSEIEIYGTPLGAAAGSP